MIRADWNINSKPAYIEDLFRGAVPLANEVLHSEAFGAALLRADLIETKGLSRAQVLDRVRRDVDCRLEPWKPWNPWTSAVAYCEGHTIYFNVRKRWTVGGMAATLLHERCHLPDCGFSHPFKWTPTRDKTVPYAVGRLAEQIILAKGNA